MEMSFVDSFGNRWEHVSGCVLCGQEDTGRITRVNPSRYVFRTEVSPWLVKCRSCRLVWPDPRIRATSKTARKPQQHGALELSFAPPSIEHDAKLLSWIEQRKGTGTLLDFGCGHGRLLQGARKHGWQVFGIEVNKEALDYVHTELGIPVSPSLQRPSFLNRSFDVVVLEEVLEHLLDPVTVLGEIYRVLRDDGIVLITTPDIGSIKARLLGSHWNMVHMTTHYYLYSKDSLSYLLNRVGFVIKDRQTWLSGGGRWRDTIKRMLAQLGLPTATHLVVIAEKKVLDDNKRRI